MRGVYLFGGERCEPLISGGFMEIKVGLAALAPEICLTPI
jgi:hypothetical protein